MIKVYEAIRQNCARLVTRYCNVDVTLNFIDGNIYAGKNAQLMTSDRFIQDAIENDSRFGSSIRLKKVIKEESDMVKAEESVDEAPVETKKKRKATEGKTQNTMISGKAEGTGIADNGNKESVDYVKTINDAVDYFAERGELVTDIASVEDKCNKLGVFFPNLKV